MKWFLAAAFVGVIAIAVVSGPRPDTAIEWTRVDLPTDPVDLETHLRGAESAFSDIVPGAEKTIVWTNPAEPRRTPLSVVYLHGFSATRQETAPLADSVATRLGANLFYTRLTGHGRTAEAMSEGSVSAWGRDVGEAIAVGRRIGDRVVLLGTSTGGTLAVWAAGEPDLSEPLAALVLVSPNLGPRDERAWMLTWPWGGLIGRAIQGPTYAFDTAGPLHARYWTEEYPTSALVPMMGLVKLVSERDGDRVTVPVLMAYSPDDRIVDPQRGLERLNTFASSVKEEVVVEQSGDPNNHVIAGDILSPETTGFLTDRIVAFVLEQAR